MIEALENFLGVATGSLLNSDYGITICVVIAGSLVFCVLKLGLNWFDKLFNRS